MAEIKHLVKIESPTEDVYRALTTQEGITSWWTSDADVKREEGEVSEFRFFKGASLKRMQIIKLVEDALVKLRCIEGPETWKHTELHFVLDQEDEDGATVLHFSHIGWRSKGSIFQLCSFDWAMYLNALRNYVESGQSQLGSGELRLARHSV